MRVFFITSAPPIPTWGGAMAFYRHFVEQAGFEVEVVTDNPQVLQHQLPFPMTLIKVPRALTRLQRTRLGAWLHGFQHLALGRRVPAEVLAKARAFKPDLIMTVAGSWSWTTEMAAQISRTLKVPLAGSFNDWYDYSLILPPSLRPLLWRRFRRFYQQCDLALCTCEGMRDALGEHRNAIIHYPSGSPIGEVSPPPPAKPFQVFFGGNLGDWYGPMIESLVQEAKASGVLGKKLDFVIFGSNASWTPGFNAFVRETGIFRGQVPFDVLKREAARAGALLLLMGFGEENKRVESTSFKTKFLDYLSFQRPIMVWGPEYSSAIRTAREFDSGETCTSDDAAVCLSQLLSLAENTPRQADLVTHSRAMYEDRFNPEKIHATFLAACRALTAK